MTGVESDTPVFEAMLHELAEFPAALLVGVTRGQTLRWLDAVDVTVTRVATDGTWADLSCTDGHATWTKRQTLPLPDSFVTTDQGTSGGVALTEELLDRLAEEAEAGYDLEQLVPRTAHDEATP